MKNNKQSISAYFYSKRFVQVFILLSSMNMIASNIDTIKIASSTKSQEDLMIKDILIIESNCFNDTILFDESNIFSYEIIDANNQFNICVYNTIESRIISQQQFSKYFFLSQECITL